jgi:hypothetical protein
MDLRNLAHNLLLESENKSEDKYFKFTDIQKQAIKFLLLNQYPDDNVLHNYCEKNNIDVKEFEKTVYSLATMFVNFLLKEGYSNKDNLKTSDVDMKELLMGIKVEMEHTDNPLLAMKISRDHLSPTEGIRDYYTRLKKMEDEAKAEGKSKGE